ncbi:MAG: phenylalanine--tRNA ligase subunit alpha [Bdellovibrionales bacterium]
MSTANLQSQLEELSRQAIVAFEAAPSAQDLYQLKVQYLGKTSPFSALMREMKNLPAEERPTFGQKVNEVKQLVEKKYEEVDQKLKSKELMARLSEERIDMTLPAPAQPISSQHPVHLVLNEMVEIFSRIGYSVRLGPLIEKDFYNFEALNMPKDHPARDMQDTFYIDEAHVLRTHTSPVQIHTMENEKPPIRIIAPGSVFRCDSDISHLPMFHQVEGLVIDENVSMADLKGTLAYFNREFFGQNVKTRFRPSFFPFTEPSAEVDCSCTLCAGKGCRLCGNSGWIEVGGCGLVNPNVFKLVGLEYPKWKGFAFGMGVERLAVVKYGIEDIRLFPENDIRFLEQF